MSNKYPGYNANDTFWDDYHRSRGMITNREFFSSNGSGGFYEGMEWDEDSAEWVPDAKTREKEYKREREKNACSNCGQQKIEDSFGDSYCDCFQNNDNDDEW